MVGGRLPRAVQVVRHHVDEVERLTDGRHVVASVDLGGAGGDGRGQEEAARLQRRLQLRHPGGEVRLVGRRRVLVVQVEAVEAVLLEELDGGRDEAGA